MKKTKAQLAYEYYMNNDVSMKEASLKYGGTSLLSGYIKTHKLPKK